MTMMAKFRLAAALFTLLPLTLASPLSLLPRQSSPSPPQALPQNAPALDLRFQPVLDFDTDGCYNVPAVSATGALVQGLPHNFVSYSSNCRDASDLDNNNVYSRTRCNPNGWCVHLYDYYFEKDVATAWFLDVGGHTHDWEHIAVWTANGTAQWVAASQHGRYEVRSASAVRWEGEHPKLVYHKDGGSTHCFRFADASDDRVENHRGVWFRGELVGFDGFPSAEVKARLFSADFGKATLALREDTFAGNIVRAKYSGIPFDENLDYPPPGMGTAGTQWKAQGEGEGWW
ncbi:necrosis inducing protein-domain-containing protein [Podospora conica]|nr:necrosis inducing protein-domain-containing protein [Schizothecium conicum]